MKILILTMSRTGSTYLSKALHSVMPDDTFLRLEPFNEFNMRKYKKVYVDFLIRNFKKKSNVLVKTHFNQIYRLKKQTQIDYFLNDFDWYKILLLRKNLFLCTLSHSVAQSINNFGDKVYEKVDLEINKDLFLHALDNKIKYWKKFSDLKAEKNYNQIIYYEDLKFNNTDIELININFQIENNLVTTSPTPSNLITVMNKNKLYSLYLSTIKDFSYQGIKNDRGFFELK